MTFNELLEEVYVLTNRRDLVAESKSAIKAATLKAHNTDFYSKDIFETGVAFDTAEYRQALDMYNLISNFRAVKYLRRVEDEFDDVGKFIEVVTADEVLDSYSCNRADIAYVAGRVLEIRSSVTFSKCLFGAYVFPIVQEENYSSWIADLHPFAIIYEAVRAIFITIGYQEQAVNFSRLVAEEYATLKMTGLTDVGY